MKPKLITIIGLLAILSACSDVGISSYDDAFVNSPTGVTTSYWNSILDNRDPAKFVSSQEDKLYRLSSASNFVLSVGAEVNVDGYTYVNTTLIDKKDNIEIPFHTALTFQNGAWKVDEFQTAMAVLPKTYEVSLRELEKKANVIQRHWPTAVPKGPNITRFKTKVITDFTSINDKWSDHESANR